MKRSVCCTGALAVLLLAVSQAITAAPADQKVDPSLLAIHEQYQPGLVRIGPRVYAGFAYDYSNFSFIEGDDGIILVDAGWFPGPAGRALADLRKHTDKPVVALVYTHLHLDHYGGAAAILGPDAADIPVYGPAGWREWVEESFSPLRPAMFRRIFMQMGMMLPYGEDGTVGNGIGPSPRLEGSVSLAHPPTVDVDQALELEISGVRLQLLPVAGDLNEHLWVWAPDDQVLFTGDTPLHATFPAMETARMELGRDAARLVQSYRRALAIDPETIVPGHGRLLRGRDDVRSVVTVNMDATAFIADQVDRYYLKGLSPDRMLDEIALPAALAGHPDLQPHYHRWEWMLRQRYIKRSGFIQESMDFLKLNSYEEARRIVPALGGSESVRKQARAALAQDDPRWAARLATYALKFDPEDAAAADIRQQAFLRVARTTPSGNERNYLLSIIREERGELDWNALFGPGDYALASTRDVDELLALLKVRFRAEAAPQEPFAVQVRVDGAAPHTLLVRSGVLYVEAGVMPGADAVLSMPRDTLDRIAARQLTLSAALDAGDARAEGDSAPVRRLAELVE